MSYPSGIFVRVDERPEAAGFGFGQFGVLGILTTFENDCFTDHFVNSLDTNNFYCTRIAS